MRTYGMKSVLILLLYAFSSSGFLQSCKKDSPAGRPPVVIDNPKPVRYLALGDSYTIGQGVSEMERFPFYTVQALRAQGIAIEKPDYIATTGWTTGNLLAAINAAAPPKYDFVTLLIGVNDQYQGVDTALYRVRFVQLLVKAKALVSERLERVVVLSIPDYSATPFVHPTNKAAVSKEIDEFNAINKDETIRQGIPYIDITPSTRRAAVDGSLLAPDSLHYSGRAHEQWAQSVAATVKTTLQ